MSDLERDGRVTCTVVNLANPYEFVSIEGRQVERATAGADQHIDAMASKYLAVDTYPFHSIDEPRIRIAIAPDRILHVAPGSPELD